MFSYFIISNLFSLLGTNHAQNQNGKNVTYISVVLVFPSLMWFVLGPACLPSVQVVRVLGGVGGTSLPNEGRLTAQTHQCPQQHPQTCG